MKRLIIIAGAVIFPLFLTTCDLVNFWESEKCPGAKKEESGSWNNTSQPSWNDPYFNVFSEGEYRVFQTSTPLYSNVCVEEHVEVGFACTVFQDFICNVVYFEE